MRISLSWFLLLNLLALLPIPELPAGEKSSEQDAFQSGQPGLLLKEFVYEQAPFPQCHASTLAETPDGLVVAWFGGTREQHADVGIWVSRHTPQGWTEPSLVDEGNVKGKDYPCWNPVLYQIPDDRLLLFYKVGPSPKDWWGMLTSSEDRGKTWSEPQRLPEGVLGPIKNKPILLEGTVLLSGSSSEHQGWRVHMERSTDWGKSWTVTEPLNDGVKSSVIQPTVLKQGDRLQILCRSRQGEILQAFSDDQGKTWTEFTGAGLPNPNSGIDAVNLKDGSSVLVYNHTKRGRSPLNLAFSSNGKDWQAALVLEDEPGEYSYPAIIQTEDGLIHVTYTWKRKLVRHAVIDPKKVQLRPIVDGEWPKAE